MTTDNKTLADVQPGGRVMLGNSNIASGLRNMLSDIEQLGAAPITVDTNLIRDAIAALSAQPSPGGQDAPERCAECRHTTFEVHPDGHICVHCKLIVAARQPVGEESEYLAELQAAVKLGGMEVTERADEDGPFPLMLVWEGTIKPVSPPAQAVDLGQFRDAITREYANSRALCDMPRILECERLLALIDSHGARNG